MKQNQYDTSKLSNEVLVDQAICMIQEGIPTLNRRAISILLEVKQRLQSEPEEVDECGKK